MGLYASGARDNRLHVAWGAVGPFGRRSFLTVEASGICKVEVRDLQDPKQRAVYRLDLATSAVAAIWQALRTARLPETALVTQALDGDFVEITVDKGGKTATTLLRNAYHRPTLLFLNALNAFLPGEVRVRYSFLDHPEVLVIRAGDI
jgi:hypothetical protein